jgi:hypothetical protein
MTTIVARADLWRTSEWYASRARRREVAVGVIALAVAMAFTVAIIATRGEPLLLAPLALTLVLVAVLARPVVGVFLLFGVAILFEQFEITGLAPITASSHVFQNISGYTPIPLRISLADLLILLTLVSWLARGLVGKHEPFRLGPFGWPMAIFAGAFVVGAVIGVARGGVLADALLAEARGPVYICVVYFLATNLIRDRAQVFILIWEFVVLVGVKAVQAILNYVDSLNLAASLEAVTGHEDVVFFDVAVVMLVVFMILGIRTKLMWALVAVQPLVITAELLTERRVGFVALGAALLAIAVLSLAGNLRRGLMFAALGAVLLGVYGVVFWEESGPLGEPLRAVRVVIDPSSVSARDRESNHWREIENRNISFTIKQVPLTGVGLGQKYFFFEDPPKLGPIFTYWRYETHNALLWLWLKAGPLGAFALWLLVARVTLLSSSLYRRLPDPRLRWIAALPVAVIAIHIAFSAVDLGFTDDRTTLFLGTTLGLGALLERFRKAGPLDGPRRETAS